MTYDAIKELQKIPRDKRPLIKYGDSGWWVRFLRQCLVQLEYKDAKGFGSDGKMQNDTIILDHIQEGIMVFTLNSSNEKDIN